MIIVWRFYKFNINNIILSWFVKGNNIINILLNIIFFVKIILLKYISKILNSLINICIYMVSGFFRLFVIICIFN